MPKAAHVDGVAYSAVSGVFINNILEESPAGRSKGFRIGDRILEVSVLTWLNHVVVYTKYILTECAMTNSCNIHCLVCAENFLKFVLWMF